MRSSGRGTFGLFLAFLCTGWYDERMKKRVAYYVSRKNPLTWIAAALSFASVVLQILALCLGEGAVISTVNIWFQKVLPMADWL